MDEKIDAQRLGGPLKHRHEDPRLPIVERTCGNEQAREQNYERYQVGAISRSVSKPPSLGSSAASAAGVSSAAAGAAGAAVGADSPSAGSLVGSAGSAGSAGPLGLSGGLGELGFDLLGGRCSRRAARAFPHDLEPAFIGRLDAVIDARCSAVRDRFFSGALRIAAAAEAAAVAPGKRPDEAVELPDDS